MSDSPTNTEALVAAATVLLVRDSNAGIEVLMVRRNSKISFGGAWAFPGGRVDAHEAEQANGDELLAARLAAVREVDEETTLQIESDSLTPWSHWTPPSNQKRRFSTWFFLCAAPSGEVVIDRGELQASDWLNPADALARHRNAEIELFPPTWITLSELSTFGSLDDVGRAANQRSVERFATRILAKDPLTLAWAGDAGYASQDPEAPGPRHRLITLGTDWRYERHI